jgi:hypothetical protein
MYQQYPGGAFPPDRYPPAGGPVPGAPHTVTVATRLMYAGAVVTALAAVGNMFLSPSLHREVQQAHPGDTPAQVSTAVHVTLGADILGAVIGITLWLLMARFCRDGRGPVRIVATVLFGLDTIVAPLTALASAHVGHAWAIFPPVAIWAVGLVTVIMLWRSESAVYFRAAGYHRSAPRYY